MVLLKKFLLLLTKVNFGTPLHARIVLKTKDTHPALPYICTEIYRFMGRGKKCNRHCISLYKSCPRATTGQKKGQPIKVGQRAYNQKTKIFSSPLISQYDLVPAAFLGLIHSPVSAFNQCFQCVIGAQFTYAQACRDADRLHIVR